VDFVAEPEQFHAQLVMKREDGTSILDTGEALHADRQGRFDVSKERAVEIQHRLQELGFTVTTGNLNTLSISGSRKLFAEIFGLESAARTSGTSAHATRFPANLTKFVADVLIPPGPEFFQ
jgi:hypothetical protein